MQLRSTRSLRHGRDARCRGREQGGRWGKGATRPRACSAGSADSMSERAGSARPERGRRIVAVLMSRRPARMAGQTDGDWRRGCNSLPEENGGGADDIPQHTYPQKCGREVRRAGQSRREGTKPERGFPVCKVRSGMRATRSARERTHECLIIRPRALCHAFQNPIAKENEVRWRFRLAGRLPQWQG